MSEKNKGGRPTKYREEFNELAYNYCLLGARDEDLARFFEVDISTITRWKHEQDGFYASIKSGKDEADALVAKSLFKRAIGYEFTEVKKETSESGIKDTVTIKEVAPDTTAQIFWLRNRQPKLWTNKQEIDHTSSDRSMSPSNIHSLTDEELLKVINE